MLIFWSSVNFQGAPPCSLAPLQCLAYVDTCHANNICLLCQLQKRNSTGMTWTVHHGTHKLFLTEVTCTFTKTGGKENLHLCQVPRQVNLLNNCYTLENKLHYFFNGSESQNSTLKTHFTGPCRYNFQFSLSVTNCLQ